MYFQQPRPIAAFIQVEIGLSQILLQIYFFGTIVFIALLIIAPLVTDIYFVYKCQFKFLLLAYQKSILCNARKNAGS